MRIEFHKLVASDISRIMEYYDDVAGPQLAEFSAPPALVDQRSQFFLLPLKRFRVFKRLLP